MRLSQWNREDAAQAKHVKTNAIPITYTANARPTEPPHATDFY